ncbi:MAG TPA: DUF2905 domain-containing protein [Spirochaetota bacterium]|nr:DUF2905 domain-containing protein [Spirochaetota bacterium]HPJ35163.1 DUF2905 domain-containing protein [Spirochaetota bacterium]
MNTNAGRYLFVAGIIIAAAGLLYIYKDSIPFIRHFGRLPGDINIKGENFSFYFPVATCILLSIIISLIIYITGKLR